MQVVDGAVLTPLSATWPCRCVVCNGEVPDAAHLVKLSWFPRWIWLIFLFSRLVGLILMVVKRQKLFLTVGLCPEHDARRKGRQRFAIVCALAGLGCLFAGLLNDLSGLAALGGLVIFSALVAATQVPVLTVQKVEGDLAWVKAGREFTASLDT